MRWLSHIAVLGFLLTGSLYAGELTLIATDNGDGTLTLGLESFTGDPPVGIALTLDPNSSRLKALHRGMPYYDIITTFDAGSNQITAFAALSTLGENDPFPAQVQNLITLDFGGPATGVIQEDSLRGGMVDTQGLPLATNLPLAFSVTLSCACNGNVNGDGVISIVDMSAITSFLSPAYAEASPPYTAPVGDAPNDCYDVNGDGIVSISDMSDIVAFLSPAYAGTSPPYTATPLPANCMP